MTTNFHLAPPPTTVDGLLAAPIDIQHVEARLAVTTGLGSKTRPDPSTCVIRSSCSSTSPVAASTMMRQSCGGFRVGSRTTKTRRGPSSLGR
jgi:hypothetical protein